MFWDRLFHRRWNVHRQIEIIKKEKECTGTDHYTGEGMYRDRPSHRRRNVQGQTITHKKECTGTEHYTLEGMYRDRSFHRKSEQLTRTFAVLVKC